MIKRTLYFVLCISFLSACTKQTGVAGPSGPAGADGLNGSILDTGSLSGNLVIYNEFGNSLKDSSGVKVTLQLNNVPRSVTSDRSGNYIFTGLPAGTYNLSFERVNCGTMKLFGISHFTPNKIPTPVPLVYLLEKPLKTAIDSISATDLGSILALRIYLDTSSVMFPYYYRNFVLLTGRTANITTANAMFVSWDEFIQPQSDGSYLVYLDKQTFAGSAPFPPPYYITAATYDRYVNVDNLPNSVDTHNYSDYIDPENGQYVYPSIKMAPNSVYVQ